MVPVLLVVVVAVLVDGVLDKKGLGLLFVDGGDDLDGVVLVVVRGVVNGDGV